MTDRLMWRTPTLVTISVSLDTGYGQGSNTDFNGGSDH